MRIHVCAGGPLCFAFFYSIFPSNFNACANRSQWGTRSIYCKLGGGCWVQDGPAAGQSRARAAAYCIYIYARARSYVYMCAHYSITRGRWERGKRII